MPQPGFFELDKFVKKLDEKDPLVNLNKLISWEDFRSMLNKFCQKDWKKTLANTRLSVN
jgi:hypothetical protein